MALLVLAKFCESDASVCEPGSDQQRKGNDLYGEAQLKRYNYERMGISQVEVYEREGKSVI